MIVQVRVPVSFIFSFVLWNFAFYFIFAVFLKYFSIANCPGDRDSIPGRVIPKTFKIVLDTSLLNTQQYKERIKGRVEQYRERSSALPYTSV